MDVKRLVLRRARQDQPLLKIRIQHPRTLHLLPIPRAIIPGERNRVPQAGLHRRVDAEADQVVQRAVTDGADDVRWAGDVPGCADGAAVGGEGVFLFVVEVAVDEDAWVGLEGGEGGWAEVEGVVLGACLEHEAARGQGGLLEGVDEIVEEGHWKGGLVRGVGEGGVTGGQTVGCGELVGMRPEVEDVTLGGGLQVGEVEDVIPEQSQ